MSKSINLSGMWIRKGPSGDYLSCGLKAGDIAKLTQHKDGVYLNLFENPNKQEGTKQPDYHLVFTPITQPSPVSPTSPARIKPMERAIQAVEAMDDIGF